LSAERHPLVAVIGAAAAAIPLAEAAFAEHFPEADLWNLLDDRLMTEAVDAGGLTPALAERMRRLVRYATDAGARGVLLTCSMYGTVAHELAAESRVPIDASDDAAFEDVLSAGHARVILLASLPAALSDAAERFTCFTGNRAGAPHVEAVLAAEAFAPAAAGDTASVADALASAVRRATAADAVLLAQYSLAPAAARLSERLGIPVIAGPTRAAARLRAAILGGQPVSPRFPTSERSAT
jgi:Asp/Glu/hydantoin racemase